MELYVLDENFQKISTVEIFQSLIWTERYNDSADCTLVYPQNSLTYQLVHEGVYLWIDGSIEAMLIDTVSTEEFITTATGRSITDFFKQRIFRDTWETTNTSVSFLGYTAAALAAGIVGAMCTPAGVMATGGVTPTDYTDEIIPNIVGGLFATGPVVNVDIPYGNLFDAVKSVCDLDALGFRLHPLDVTSSAGNIAFDTYRGLDRTSTQDDNTLVVFEPAMDSLTDIKELRSISGYKNAAYAWANGMTDQTKIGYAFAGVSSPSGFDRRTLMVDASDINAADYSGADLKALLDARALNALANNNYVRTTDGLIVPQNSFVYGRDYTLGDIIELRGLSSGVQPARVTEYIRSQDETGESAYPTLSTIS